MSNNHPDQLIENALALLRQAVGNGQSESIKEVPAAEIVAVETNVIVATEYPDGHTSVVSASAIEIAGAPEPEQQKPKSTVEYPDKDAPELTEEADLVSQTLSIMRSVTNGVPKAPSTSADRAEAKLPGPKKWLDMERAEMRRRVEAFKATQQRFQREREEYCAAALAAARAGNWTTQQT